MWQKNRALTQGKPCSCRASFNNLWLLQAKLLQLSHIKSVLENPKKWLHLSCSLHNNSQGTWLADRILSPAHPNFSWLWNFWNFWNSSSPLTSPLGHSSTDPRDHTLVNHWKTKFLDPKGTIKCCLAHPRIELAFSINRLQGSKSFTFSSAEGSEGFHRSPAHTNIESASQTCGLSFCSMLTRYSRYSRGLRWLQSVTNTWKSRELEESKQIISWDDWSSIRDRHEESLKKHGIECKRSRVRNKLHLFVFHSLACFLLQM